MIPIVTPEEMAAVDAAAPEPVDELIARAGAAVAWAARRRLGGAYGRRVVVLAGKGNNGADGRIAADRLRGWGARVAVIDATEAPEELPACDLVIDAAYGTGLTREYNPPGAPAPVLAVDIPSGVDGATGEIPGGALAAVETVTFQALKPGLAFQPGRGRCGSIGIADLGLDVSGASAHMVTASDVAAWLPARPAEAHKWRSACWVIAGSPGMFGAGWLASAAAARSGSGYVRHSAPGGHGHSPVEVVEHVLPATGWGRQLDDAHRFGGLVIGPGLGRAASTLESVRDAIASTTTAAVIDADGLAALVGHHPAHPERLVLTPHDGEYELLTGRRPGPDRIGAARDVARTTGSTVLLKGPTTVVASPDGAALVSATGDQRLASAGTGDVLAGLIGALLARGVDPFRAAALGAWIHGRAAELAPRHGMVASDLLTFLPEVLDASHLG
ncbi:MAG: NAD(P)H-hydrate dehydratase [Actinomycetota bacterium]